MDVLCKFNISQSFPRGHSIYHRNRLQQFENYICQIENQVIHEDSELRFIGEHLNGKTNYDVNVISFKLCYITKVPKDLLNHFPNLQSLIIYGSNLKVLNKNDLINYKQFKSLNFDSNQIEFLPGDLFEGFVVIEEISFNNNNLRVIEPTIFDDLKRLYLINLRCNPCYHTWYASDNEFITLPKLRQNLTDIYFARFPFITQMKNSIEIFETENQELKEAEIRMSCEIADLKRSLETEKSKKSNLNLPHQSCFCSELKEVLKDENNFKDFTIMIENEEIQVSKLLLAARSPVLKSILERNPNTESFNLVDISMETFREILKYLYTDELDFEEISNSMHLFGAAHRLQINRLKDIAAMEISNKITPENAIEILFLGNKFEHDRLRQNAFNEVKNNYLKIEFRDEWAVQPEKVKQIVEAYNAKEEKLQRIETMIENIEQQFQDLLEEV